MSDHPRRTTWRDWWPASAPEPLDLITRAELLAQLEARNVDVDERTLRHWERQSVLPPPVRQSYQGRVQALYPNWMANVVADVAQLRQSLPLRRLHNYGRILFADYATMHAEETMKRAAIPRERPAISEPALAVLGQFLAQHGGGTMTITVDWHDGRRSLPRTIEVAPRAATDTNGGTPPEET